MSTVRFDPKVFEKPGSPGSVGPTAGASGVGGAGFNPLPPERYYFVIGGGVGVCVGVIVAVSGWPDDWGLLGMFQATVRAIGAGAFSGALTGLLLALVATVKDWVYQLLEWKRARRWAQEDRERVIAGETVKVIELSSGFRLDYVAMLILAIAFLDGEKYTRETLAADEKHMDGLHKICTPKEWNQVMDVMSLIGLRTGQKLKTDELSYEQAVLSWRAHVTPEKDGLRVGAVLLGGKPTPKGGKKK